MKNIFSYELARFIIVGTLAAFVHFTCVILLVQSAKWHPLLANIAAFIVAFQVSYSGHRFWTFPHTSLQHKKSLPRFFLIATSSFILNEGMYYLLLRYTSLPYWLSLGIVLVMVAALTFLSSRLWAFKQHPQ